MSEDGVAYLVTDGCYSNYQVLAVFSTRELAQAYLDDYTRYALHRLTPTGWQASGARDAGIEEVPFDNPIPARLGAWTTRVSATGEVAYSSWREDVSPSTPAAPIRHGFGNDGPWFLGFGETQEHARRSAEDCRRAWLTSPAAKEKRAELAREDEFMAELKRLGGNDTSSVIGFTHGTSK